MIKLRQDKLSFNATKKYNKKLSKTKQLEEQLYVAQSALRNIRDSKWGSSPQAAAFIALDLIRTIE